MRENFFRFLEKSLFRMSPGLYALLLSEYLLVVYVAFRMGEIVKVFSAAAETGESAAVAGFFPELLFLLFVMLALTFGVDLLVRNYLFESLGGEKDRSKKLLSAKKNYPQLLVAGLVMFFCYGAVWFSNLFLSVSFALPFWLSTAFLLFFSASLNVFFYFTNPFIVLKDKDAFSAIRSSFSLLKKHGREVVEIFAVISVLTYAVSVSTLTFLFGVELDPSSFVGPRLSTYLVYSYGFTWVLVVQTLISSFFDFFHISARAEYLVEES